jgi:hypothetical protein
MLVYFNNLKLSQTVPNNVHKDPQKAQSYVGWTLRVLVLVYWQIVGVSRNILIKMMSYVLKELLYIYDHIIVEYVI